MSIPEERLRELKEIIEKDKGEAASEEEVSRVAASMEGLARIFVDHYFEDQRRKARLKEFPKGFVLDSSGYTCFICGRGTPLGENWYDKWGIKCSTCQAGINRGEIPASLAARKDSWYSAYELERAFSLKGPALKAWIKEGIIKSRTITDGKGGTHVQLFLLKDNEGFLPPKKLVESKTVSSEKDGQKWFRSEPWYRFVDPFEHLKGYRIMDYMRVIPPEEMTEREAEQARRKEAQAQRRRNRKPRKKRASR